MDLHTHSTASDGEASPRELVALAARSGVDCLSLTDHDTTSGLLEAQAEGLRLGVRVVPGIELGCMGSAAQVDILGYLFDPAEPGLVRLLADIRTARTERARQSVEKLQNLGLDITYHQVAALAAGSVGRPHIARALVANACVNDVATAFKLYLKRGAPGYVERYRLTPESACAAIRAAGGVPALAHPVAPGRAISATTGLSEVLADLVAAGLGAVEAFYPGYSPPVERWLLTLADHYGLVATGGTDYHGSWRNSPNLGSVPVPPDTLERLEAARQSG